MRLRHGDPLDWNLLAGRSRLRQHHEEASVSGGGGRRCDRFWDEERSSEKACSVNRAFYAARALAIRGMRRMPSSPRSNRQRQSREEQMPKGYWIGRIDVKDEEGYKPCIAANGPICKKFGAK